MTKREINEWQNIIRDWEMSGLSAQAYCQKHNLANTTFWKWKKKFGLDEGRIVPVSAQEKTRFIDVTPAAAQMTLTPSPQSILRIRLTNGCIIEVPL